ncbi:Na/Pi cotransporter family protein [Thiorhodospira sibirica]|uniref:Na/Pi cotransporter family protein n=1 Tax=Thiorhodospira sibirica TaxID=154347 RepID=UPI00022C1776|nr:Na/Pi symporter [Thiorhodospira sibirica]
MTARRIVLLAALCLLAYGFWISPDFKEIAAGVALFLFGMMCLEDGFKSFTGGTLEALLRHSTNRLWKSIVFGISSTTLMQSSTLVSLITISFVSAEMITLAAGIGIIMGANLGTTSGAWLIAGLGLRVDIAAYAMPMLVFGVVLLLQKSQTLKGIGYVCLGAGFLFLGIHYMKEGFEAFQGRFDLAAYAVSGLPGVLLFTVIGMLITVVMQSSHATLLIIITALSTGQVSYENALALAIGANLGSAITTALGGMTSNLGGKRLAVAHVLFNVMTASVAIALIEQMMWAVDALSGLLGIGADNLLLKLALFHTLFNLLGVLLLMPFVKQLETLLLRYLKGLPSPAEQPRYLNPQTLGTAATAVGAVKKEVARLYDNAYGLLAHGLSLRRAVITSDQSLAEAVKNTRRIMPLDLDDVYETKIKSLHSDIIAYISEAQGMALPEHIANELYTLRQASQDIVDAVKGMKHLHKNLARYGLSSNLAVRERYDAIRLQLAKLLREIEQLRLQERDEVTSLSLDALKLTLQKATRTDVSAIDEMIRTRRISPHIATSLMNDEGYAQWIGENLIDAAQGLLLSDSRTEQVAAASLSLSEQEINEIAGTPASIPSHLADKH